MSLVSAQLKQGLTGSEPPHEASHIPLCGKISRTFRICTPHNLGALYRIELVLKPLVSAVTQQQGCWRLIDAAN